MGENNLDDLILTEPESEGGKNRGLLVILGLVVLLLILGVVLANIIFGGGSDDNATAEGVKNETAQVLNSEDKNVNNLEIEENKSNVVANDNQNENLDADLAPLDDKENLANANMDDTIKDDMPKEDTTNQNGVTAAASAAATAATASVSNVVAKKKEAPKPKKVNKPKKVEHKIKHIVKNKPKAKKSVNVSYGGNVYIQVGSFSKGPNEAFINKIRNAGLRYRIKEANGYRRVLIGPFKSSSDAQRVLGVVKAKVSPSAFIKR